MNLLSLKLHVSPYTLKLVFGKFGVGKTTFSARFMTERFIIELEPTIEETYRKLYQINGKTYSFEVNEAVTQEEFLVLTDKLIHESNGFLLLFDMSQKDTLSFLETEVEKILNLKGPNVFMVLVGTKIDLVEEANAEEIDTFSKKFNLPFIKTSAKDGVNVHKAFEMLVEQMNKPITSNTKTNKSECQIM